MTDIDVDAEYGVRGGDLVVLIRLVGLLGAEMRLGELDAHLADRVGESFRALDDTAASRWGTVARLDALADRLHEAYTG